MSARSINLKIDPGDLARIDRMAQNSKLSRTQYMIRASLGEITNPTDADTRLAALEERFARLEDRVYLSQ